MPLANVLILSQIAGHVIILILSLCVIVPLQKNLNEFNGHCLLFTPGKWREDDGKFETEWSSTLNCNFPLITGIFLFLVSIAQIYRYSRLKDESPFLALFVDVVLGMMMLAMSIISAIMITLGFIVWCSSMTERFPSCETAAGQDIIKTDEKLDTTNFYIEMGTSQFGAWGCFAASVGIAVIALLKLINNHQVRNIKVSMYLERQRLVNEDALNVNNLFEQQQQSIDGRSTPPNVSDLNK